MDQASIPVKQNVGPIKAASGKPTSVGPLFSTTRKHLSLLVDKTKMMKESQDSPLSFKTKPGTAVSLAFANGEHPELHAADLPKPVDISDKIGNKTEVKGDTIVAQNKVEVKDLAGLLACITKQLAGPDMDPRVGILYKQEAALTA